MTERVTLDVPASLRHLSILGAALQAWCKRLAPAAAGVAGEIELALQEAATNIVNHGYADGATGRLVVDLHVDGSEITVILYDHGRPFDPTTVPEPDLDTPREHGYGMFLMRQLMDDVSYERVGDRNRTTMRKRLVG